MKSSNKRRDYYKREILLDGFRGEWNLAPGPWATEVYIADPRDRDMQKKLNLKIKFRESFRPFAPAIAFEWLEDYFESTRNLPLHAICSWIAKTVEKGHCRIRMMFWLLKRNFPLIEVIYQLLPMWISVPGYRPCIPKRIRVSISY